MPNIYCNTCKLTTSALLILHLQNFCSLTLITLMRQTGSTLALLHFMFHSYNSNSTRFVLLAHFKSWFQSHHRGCSVKQKPGSNRRCRIIVSFVQYLHRDCLHSIFKHCASHFVTKKTYKLRERLSTAILLLSSLKLCTRSKWRSTSLNETLCFNFHVLPQHRETNNVVLKCQSLAKKSSGGAWGNNGSN